MSLDIDILSRISINITGDIDDMYNGILNFSALAFVKDGIREDDILDNSVSTSIFLGFSNGFE